MNRDHNVAMRKGLAQSRGLGNGLSKGKHGAGAPNQINRER